LFYPPGTRARSLSSTAPFTATSVGGLAAISDVPKTMIYRLAGQINRKCEMIPAEIIRRAPSAELKPDQKDQDTLPPYEVLDSILHQYVEEGLSAREIVDLASTPRP
jgi:NAD+ synthase (glutamine-hydrolysing)